MKASGKLKPMMKDVIIIGRSCRTVKDKLIGI